ncbi:hypothetical protein JOQ06_013738 [Pogonophryne albipinna]|uniref:Ubinuclein-2-like n=1 Tax=Pogonophryne albipinna TaxID=1090488 RepID=A0AAD6FSC5_9TELE|nr:hypothetical protein JOQ06_013738 [Pogonophryne albipinna]
MAEPRKVQFVTLSAFAAGAAAESRKRRLEDEADFNFGEAGEVEAATGAGGAASNGRLGQTGDGDTAVVEKRVTVRLNLSLPEPDDRSSAEFNYGELIQNRQAKKTTQSLTSSNNPNDPFNDDERVRLQVEALAKKLENKYGNEEKKKKKDRMQDLIDIGFGYDDADPFIDNSEAYDELVPASLTTKLGGFYINTGTLQFRAASDSEGEEGKSHRPHPPKEDMMKINSDVAHPGLAGGVANKPPSINSTNHLLASNSTHNAAGSDFSLADLTSDPAVMSLLGSANEKELQDLLGDLDFSVLDSDQQHAIGLFSPPPLPDGLPAPLIKRIEDLRAASRQFDQEGRKKFFTLDMNNILLDVELQVQEQPPEVRLGIYSHMEAFVPCNKEALLKRLKKLSLNIQDDRLRTPLLKLKLAVCSSMPEQIARYNMDCMAKVAKQQSGEGEKNGSEEEDEEKPGKRVMGPRKKFVWDDKLRNLLCSLVRVKLSCYEMENQCSLSVEDYLKAFLENEVKPLWPKGWMQARILLKESLAVHSHLTGSLVKRRMVPGPRAKAKEGLWIHKPPLSMTSTSSLHTSALTSHRKPASCSPPEPICLSDSLDEDLTAPSLDSISHALALLSNASKGLGFSDSPLSPPPLQMPTSSPPPVTPHYPSASQLSASIASTTQLHSLSRGEPSPLAAGLSLASRTAEGPYGLIKGSASMGQSQPQRLLTMATPNHRTGLVMGGNGKMHPHPSPSPPKQRPPPTASPLLPPHQKAFVGPGGLLGSLGGLAKSKTISSNGSATPSSSPSSMSRSNSASHPGLQSFCPPSLMISSQQQQHQFSLKTPKAFRPPFSVSGGGGVQVKPPQSTYSFARGPKALPTTSNSSINNNSVINKGVISAVCSRVDKTPLSSAPSVSANHAQRQRVMGGANQSPKALNSWTTLASSSTTSHLPQVSTVGSPLLGGPSPLSLGFGMLGGLVHLSQPFQFPPLLNFSPGVPGAAGMGSVPSSNSGYTLAQSDLMDLYKSLQSGSQAALPPHLQLAFSDANQSQGGDMKRKSH